MQLKIFTGLDALEARRMLKKWRQERPQARVIRQKSSPPQEAFGQFGGKRVHQIVVEYEGG
jgi:hypothetical protein